MAEKTQVWFRNLLDESRLFWFVWLQSTSSTGGLRVLMFYFRMEFLKPVIAPGSSAIYFSNEVCWKWTISDKQVPSFFSLPFGRGEKKNLCCWNWTFWNLLLSKWLLKTTRLWLIRNWIRTDTEDKIKKKAKLLRHDTGSENFYKIDHLL